MKIHYEATDAALALSVPVCFALRQAAGSPLAIVCVGTDRVTGDAFGPMIGTVLSREQYEGVTVYGTLKDPVHAQNIAEVLAGINKSSFVFGIDSCLGRWENVGKLGFFREPLYPGAGVGTDLAPFGDCSLTGVVNVAGFMPYQVLSNTRLATVIGMAEVTADAVRCGLQRALHSDSARSLVAATVFH